MESDINFIVKYLTMFLVAGVVGFLCGLAWGWLRLLLGDLSSTVD